MCFSGVNIEDGNITSQCQKVGHIQEHKMPNLIHEVKLVATFGKEWNITPWVTPTGNELREGEGFNLLIILIFKSYSLNYLNQ